MNVVCSSQVYLCPDGVTTQQTNTDVFTAVRTSNFIIKTPSLWKHATNEWNIIYLCDQFFLFFRTGYPINICCHWKKWYVLKLIENKNAHNWILLIQTPLHKTDHLQHNTNRNNAYTYTDHLGSFCAHILLYFWTNPFQRLSNGHTRIVRGIRILS